MFCIMDPRRQIVEDLIQADLISDFDDSGQVANALEKGKSRDEILYSGVLERWPKAFAFLKDRL